MSDVDTAQLKPGRALISGGSGGIGTAITRRLVADGWEVVIGYVSESRALDLANQLRNEGATAWAAPLDLSSPSLAHEQTGAILAEHGACQSVVLNAGWTRRVPFLDTAIENQERTLAVNFLGPVAVVDQCLPSLLASGSGSIVGICSDAARVGEALSSIYAAGKAALAEYLFQLNQLHSSKGLRTACVAPGPIDTPMLQEVSSSAEEETILRKRLTALVPLRRLGRAEEVAAAVELVVNGVSIGGRQLSVGGGITMVG